MPYQSIRVFGPYGIHVSRFDHFTKGLAELRISVMQQIAAASQASPLLHSHVSCLLLHPLLIRVRRESYQAHSASLQVNEEKHIVCQQPRALSVRTSVVKKSIPTKTSRCERIKSFHETVCLRFGAGERPWRRRMLPTV